MSCSLAIANDQTLYYSVSALVTIAATNKLELPIFKEKKMIS